MTAEEIEALKTKWKEETRDAVIAAAQRSFLIGYEVGCRHVAHADTTSAERRDLDCNESTTEIAVLITAVIGEAIRSLPRHPIPCNE